MKYPKRSQYKHAKQKKYHVSNWAEYNEGLRRRGDLTVWFDERQSRTGRPTRAVSLAVNGSIQRWRLKRAWLSGWCTSLPTAKPKASCTRSPRFSGCVSRSRDYSTLCRRSRLLRKKLRIRKAASNQPIHLMIDSTGLRIHVGTTRKPPKQRAWRKLHIAVDRKTGNIVASELTASRARDATRVPPLLTQIQAPIASVAGGQCIRQGSGLRSHRSAQPWTKDARGDSAATKRHAQSEFEHRHAGTRPPYSCNRKTRPT